MKLLVAVMTCHALDYYIDDSTTDWLDSRGMRQKDQQARMKAIRDTWLRSESFSKVIPDFSIDYKFFYGTRLRRTDIKPNQRPGTEKQAPPLRTPLTDEVFLPCGDNYTQNSAKMKEICRYAIDFGYDYILRVDDDTLVFLDQLLSTDWDKYAYSGAATGAFHPGSCMFLSRTAMQAVVNARITSYADDLWVGQVMSQTGTMRHDIDGIRHDFGDRYAVNPDSVTADDLALHSCTPDVMRTIWTRRTTALSAQQKATAGAPSKTTQSPSPNPVSEDEKSSSSVTSLTPLGEHLQNSDLNSSITSALETIPSSNDSAYFETGLLERNTVSATSSTATSETL